MHETDMTKALIHTIKDWYESQFTQPKIKKIHLRNKKKSFDSYSKKPLKDEVRKAMKRYFAQLDQKICQLMYISLCSMKLNPLS